VIDDWLLHHVRAKDQLQPPRPIGRSVSPLTTPGTARTIEISSFSCTFAPSPAPSRTSSSFRYTLTELTQLTFLVEQSILEPRGTSVERRDGRAEISSLDVHGGLAFGERRAGRGCGIEHF